MTNIRIGILDYGLGNLGSIYNMLKYIEFNPTIVNNFTSLKDYDLLILPGVGKFDTGIDRLMEKNFYHEIKSHVFEKQKFLLGICLGMQLLCHDSEEGTRKGLGIFDANVIKLNKKFTEKLLIPHMGWNYVHSEKDKYLLNGIKNPNKFYFVHSYYVDCKNKEDILFTTEYGFKFPSAIKKDNVMGVQFHPEKSHKYGMKLFKNILQNL